MLGHLCCKVLFVSTRDKVAFAITRPITIGKRTVIYVETMIQSSHRVQFVSATKCTILTEVYVERSANTRVDKSHSTPETTGEICNYKSTVFASSDIVIITMIIYSHVKCKNS